MSIVVAYKYTANPQDAKVNSDGTVDWSRAKAAVSEYDPVAIQLGRDLADTLGVELVGISVGDKQVSSSMAKKQAMSKGFDRGVVVADDATAGWNSTKTASALAGLVGRVGDVDLLLTGDSSIDDGARIVPALIAGYLNWPCFEEVVAVAKDGDTLTITQRISGGTRTVKVTGPAVLAAASDAVVPKVVSMKEILAAGKKPVEEVNLADLDVVDAELSVTGREKPVAKARKNKVFTGETAVADMVSALRADGIL